MKYNNNNQNIKNGVKVILTIIVLLFTFHFLPLTSPTAHAAEQTLRISPVIINISLSPGKVSSQEATIENLTNTPLPLRATLNDFVTSGEEGGYIFEDTKDNPLLSWIKLSETEFILNPKEKKKIQLTITTPRSIPLGGYYGVLFFEPVLQNKTPQATRVSTKVGILMLANIGVPDPKAKKAEILAFSTDFLHETGTVPFLLRVQNVSLNFFTAKPAVTITPLISTVSETQPIYLEEKIIFPGKIRRWTDETTVQDLSPNIYKATMSVSTGNGQVIAEERYFIVFPFIKALGIGIIILLLLFIFVKRKRLKLAMKALFRS